MLGQAMTLGYRALKFSANAALRRRHGHAGREAGGIFLLADDREPPVFPGFFIFLYKFVPLFLATRLGKSVPSLSGRFATT